MAAYTAPIKYFQQNTNASFWQKFRLFDLQWLRFSIFFFFYLNLSECDCCTAILISHYLIASIFLKIRSQNWSKVCNFSCNIGTCNTYVRLFSQRFFLQFLIHQDGKNLYWGITLTCQRILVIHKTNKKIHFIKSFQHNFSRPVTILVDLFNIVLLYFSSLVW